MKKKKIFPTSAANLMTRSVPIASVNDSIETVKKNFFKEIKKLKSINYVYVIDNKNFLKGKVSIRELFQQTRNRNITAIMEKNLVYAYKNADREEVAYLALKNNIKSVPILDKKNKFAGVVLNDDILKIIYKELQEDISHFIGLDSEIDNENLDDIRSMSIYASLKNRLPWLIVGILGGVLAAQVISMFEQTLSKNIILAAFIPLVVYIASAIGTQAGFFIVRDLAINKTINFFSYTFKQFKVISAMGVIIGCLIFIFSLIFYQSINLALILSLSIFLTIISAIITGIFIPYAFSRLKFDPANASGPIATIIQDFLSVSIYLIIASALL